MRAEKEGKQWQNVDGETAKKDLNIYIGASQWIDPVITVTPAVNALPNSPISLYDRTLRIPPNGTTLQWLPPKRRAKLAGKQTAMALPSIAR
jgi:hypothetical protein